MFAGLLAKVAPFRDWAYLAIALAAVVFYNVHVHGLIKAAVEHERAAVIVASDAVRAQAASEKAAMVADYEKRSQERENVYTQAIASAVATHNADIKLLRQHPASGGGEDGSLHGAAGPSGESDTGSGSGSVDYLGELSEVALVSLGLADAVRHDDALLASCRADRDALTGK